jgi:hypothetical protein
VQPSGPAADPKPGLIQVLHPCRRHLLARRVSEATEAIDASCAHPGDGGRNQLETEQIGQEFGKPVLEQKVIVQQVDHKGADPCAILDRCGDPLGKGRRRDRLTARAHAAVGAMFGHHHLRLWDIENLSGLVAGVCRQRLFQRGILRLQRRDSLVLQGALRQQPLNLLNQPLDVGRSLHPALESDSSLRHQLLYTARVNSPHRPLEGADCGGPPRTGDNRSGYRRGYLGSHEISIDSRGLQLLDEQRHSIRAIDDLVSDLLG